MSKILNVLIDTSTVFVSPVSCSNLMKNIRMVRSREEEVFVVLGRRLLLSTLG